MAISADADRVTQLEPNFSGDFAADRVAATRYFAAGEALIAGMPPRPERSAAEQAEVDELQTRLRSARLAFLRRHVARLYSDLSEGLTRFIRVEDLVYRAAKVVP